LKLRGSTCRNAALLPDEVGLGPRGVFDGAGAAPFKSPSVGKTQLVRCAQIASLPGSFFAGGSEEPRSRQPGWLTMRYRRAILSADPRHPLPRRISPFRATAVPVRFGFDFCDRAG
jgi:hypothetical protein